MKYVVIGLVAVGVVAGVGVVGKYNMERRRDILLSYPVQGGENEYTTTMLSTKGVHKITKNGSTLTTNYVLSHGPLTWLGADMGIKSESYLSGDLKKSITYNEPQFIKSSGSISSAGDVTLYSTVSALDILSPVGLVSISPMMIDTTLDQVKFKNHLITPLITGRALRIENFSITQSTDYAAPMPTGTYKAQAGSVQFQRASMKNAEIIAEDSASADYSVAVGLKFDQFVLPNFTRNGQADVRYSVKDIDKEAMMRLIKLYQLKAPEKDVKDQVKVIMAKGINFNVEKFSLSSETNSVDMTMNYFLRAKTDATRDSKMTASVKAKGPLAVPLAQNLGQPTPLDVQVRYEDRHLFIGGREAPADSIIESLLRINELLGL